MTKQTPTLTDQEEDALLQSRLDRFQQDGLGHSAVDVRDWIEARRKDANAPCPPPTKLR